MMSDDAGEDGSTPSQQPHRAIRLLAVVIGASVIGATLGAFVAPPTTLGEVLVAVPLILLALTGTFGVLKNEPILGALAGLGLLLVLEPLVQVAIILLAGAFGFLLVATLAALETYFRERDR